jgi:hypothetical protein
MGTQGVKRPPTSIQYRGEELWSYTSTPAYVFIAQCLTNFTFLQKGPTKDQISYINLWVI